MRRLIPLFVLLLSTTTAHADLVAPPNLRLPTPGEVCRSAIAAAERGAGIPQALLAAIARIESGRYDPATNRTTPWPWTINAEGRPGVFETKEQAIAAVRAAQAQGVRSIDVGCMQVNLMHHPNAFANLEQAFDPVVNANYGARFLTQLRDQTGNWEAATARYHSATPELGSAYQRKVAGVMAEEQRFASSTPLTGISPQAGRVMVPELARSGTPVAGLTPPGGIMPAAGSTPPGSVMPAAGFIPPGNSNVGRIIPLAMAGNGTTPPGRALDAYRSQPISVASRPRG